MTDALAFPEPPGDAELQPALATVGVKRVADRNASVVDPAVPATRRLLTGARIMAGGRGADREAYRMWQADRSAPTPPRVGTDVKQAKILAAPDNLERGKALGSEPAAAWLEATKVDPIDVARFDRAPKSGRARELYERTLQGSLKDDLEAWEMADLVSKAGATLEDFDDDLSLGNGTVVDINERVRVHWDSEPAPGAVTALSLDTLPIGSFDGDVKDGFDTLVGDDVVVAAPVESQPMLRRAFPAATYGEGTPRWLSVQPAKVAGLRRAVESAGADPAANVSVHMGGHPGLAPYDSVTFTTRSDRRRDRFRALGAEHVGRGLVAVPRFTRRPVTVEELVDAPTVDKLIDETAWAIYPGQREGIPVRSGDEDFTLVFGIDPEEAAEATDGFVYVNDGLATVNDYDGLEPYSDDPRWFEVKLRDGGRYRFPVSQDEALLWPERVERAVDRWQIPLDDRNRATVSGLAAHLEMLEAEDVAAYATGRPGEGFVEAREVLWGDGYGNVASARIAGTRSGANVIPVWVRRPDGIPEDSTISADLLDTEDEEAQAQQVGSKWRVDARDTQDVAQAVRQGHALALKHGYDNVEVLTDRGPLELVR